MDFVFGLGMAAAAVLVFLALVLVLREVAFFEREADRPSKEERAEERDEDRSGR